MDFKFLHELIAPAHTKIVMLVMDGLGGLPLEPAAKPNWKLHTPPTLICSRKNQPWVFPCRSGRASRSRADRVTWLCSDMTRSNTASGAVCWKRLASALTLNPTILRYAATTVPWTQTGVVTDRRAGRIPSEISKELSKLLTTRIEDVDFFVETVREHRLAIIMRGPGLSANVSGTDPLKDGYRPLPVRALDSEAVKTARVMNLFVERSRQVIESLQTKTICQYAAHARH